MSKHWKWYLPVGWVVCLPLNLAAMVLYTLVYRAHTWRWHEGILTCIAGEKTATELVYRAGRPVTQVMRVRTRIWGEPGAQTIGMIVCGASEMELARRDLRVHEFTHVVQAMVIQTAIVALLPLWYIAPVGWSPGGIAFNLLTGFVAIAPMGVVYLALFLVHYLDAGERDEQPGWHDDYRRNPLEKHAYHVGDALNGWGDSPYGV